MDESLVFFGSGPVAAQSLELLAKSFTIEAVVTKPQPSHHKEIFPVLASAAKLGLKTLQTSNKNELSELFDTKPVSSRLGVVIDYGIIINQDVIDYFSLGIVNSHFSLLPQWRGADPITFSILSGQKQTGVSLMLIVPALDEGPLLAQTDFEIPDGFTTPELTNSLIELSDYTLREILPLYINGQVQPREQLEVSILSDKTPTYSRKLSKADGILDFAKTATQLEREIRAYIDWPKSRTTLTNKEVIVTLGHAQAGSGKPGTIWRDGKQFGIYCAEDVLVVDKLKPAGKPEMSASAFMAGYGHLL